MDPFYTQPDNNGTMTPCRKDQNSGLYEKRKSAFFGDISYTLPKWNFDSHPAHPVVGVYRFLIMLCPAKVDDNGNLKPCDGASATANGYLNVGYTGSGGAG
jgi:hypothetical protein